MLWTAKWGKRVGGRCGGKKRDGRNSVLFSKKSRLSGSREIRDRGLWKASHQNDSNTPERATMFEREGPEGWRELYDSTREIQKKRL